MPTIARTSRRSPPKSARVGAKQGATTNDGQLSDASDPSASESAKMASSPALDMPPPLAGTLSADDAKDVPSPSKTLRRRLPSSIVLGQGVSVTPALGAVPDGTLLLAIRETHRQRNDFIRAEGSLQRQVKAICRRAVGFSTFDPAPERAEKMKAATALFAAVEAGAPDGQTWVAFASTVRLRQLRDEAAKCRKDMEKQLVKLAKQSHVAGFVEQTPGFGYIGLAQIIGEAGDLGKYGNPAKLWKRMGLGLISSGQRQQKFTDPAKALEAGYNPRRRSTMFVIGDSMLKSKGPYREVYLQRKVFEIEKAKAAGLQVLPSAKIKKAEAAKCRSEGHVHIRAQRYAEKRLLRDLWRVWRGQVGEPAFTGGTA